MPKDNFIKRQIKNWLGIKDEDSVREPVSEALPYPVSGIEPPLKKTSDYLNSCVGWVYAAVSVIADEIGGIELHLYKKNRDKIEEIKEHPLLDLLYRCNDFTSKFDHWWSTQQYLELTGEAPWYLERKAMTAKPSQILLLRPDLLDIKFDKENGNIKYYEYRIDPQNPIRIEDYELIFLRYPDPLNPFRGSGTLKAAARTVDLDEYSEKWNVNFFYNSARPDGILTTEQRLTKGQLEDLRRQWNAMYGSVENASKVAILHGGLSYNQMQLSQKEMDFLEQQRFSRDKILSIFRVPKTAIGLTEDVNRANAEATDYVFASRTIRPKMKRIIGQLNEFLVPIYGDNLFLDFKDPVPEDIKTMGDERRKNVSAGILSINEAREEIGEEPVEGGDTIYIPFNVQPLGETEKGKSKKEDFSEQKKMLSAREGEERRKARKKIEKIEKQINKFAKEYIKETIRKKEEEKPKFTKEEKYWKKQIYITEKYEDTLTKNLKKFFNEQKKRVIEDLFSKKDVKFSLPRTILKLAREKGLLGLAVRPTIQRLMKEEGDEAFSFIGMPDAELDMTLGKVQKHLDEHIDRMVDSVNKTTLSKLRKTLKEGIANGESVAELTKRVRNVYRSASVSRASAIARTEVMKAANVASVEAYK